MDDELELNIIVCQQWMMMCFTQVTVLPPGEWDPSIRIEPPTSLPSQVCLLNIDKDDGSILFGEPCLFCIGCFEFSFSFTLGNIFG